LSTNNVICKKIATVRQNYVENLQCLSKSCNYLPNVFFSLKKIVVFETFTELCRHRTARLWPNRISIRTDGRHGVAGDRHINHVMFTGSPRDVTQRSCGPFHAGFNSSLFRLMTRRRRFAADGKIV